jgi:hypothetical protein
MHQPPKTMMKTSVAIWMFAPRLTTPPVALPSVRISTWRPCGVFCLAWMPSM